MASERWHPGEHEARSCLTKHRYNSAVAAGKAKDHMRRRAGGPCDESMNVYRCHYCDGWHLGRPRKKRTLRNRAQQLHARQAEIHVE